MNNFSSSSNKSAVFNQSRDEARPLLVQGKELPVEGRLETENGARQSSRAFTCLGDCGAPGDAGVTAGRGPLHQDQARDSEVFRGANAGHAQAESGRASNTRDKQSFREAFTNIRHSEVDLYPEVTETIEQAVAKYGRGQLESVSYSNGGLLNTGQPGVLAALLLKVSSPQ